MASETLPVFSHPNFPQVLDGVIGQQIRRVDAIFADVHLDRIRQARLREAECGLCSWTSPESRGGGCDGGFPCYETAVVHHLSSDTPYCLSHFREVELG